MSFSIGLGDIKATWDLITLLKKALSDIDGPSASYQHLIRRLETLSSTIDLISRCSRDLNRKERQVFKKALSNCRKSLRAFYRGIMKYGRYLGHHSPQGWLKTTLKKIEWQAQASDIQEFNQRLNDDIQALQTLVQALGYNLPSLEGQLELACTHACQDYTTPKYHQRAMLNVQTEITNMERAHRAQARGLPKQICRLPPVIFINAQNQISHFHVENVNTTEAFMQFLHAQFPTVGSGKVEKGDFAIRRRSEATEVDMRSPFTQWFVPGGEYHMSFVFYMAEEPTATCPSCLAPSNATSEQESKCTECGIQFCRVTELGDGDMPKATNDISPSEAGAAEPAEGPRQRSDQPSDFRRIKLVQRIPLPQGAGASTVCQCSGWGSYGTISVTGSDGSDHFVCDSCYLPTSWGWLNGTIFKGLDFVDTGRWRSDCSNPGSCAACRAFSRRILHGSERNPYF